jgi:hypothetical protein
MLSIWNRVMMRNASGLSVDRPLNVSLCSVATLIFTQDRAAVDFSAAGG